MEDFARCAALLASPSTEPALRAQADSWLAAFRIEPAAWSAALGVLRGDAGAAPPEARLQATSLLAWKAKRQLLQLQPVERQAELAEALAALVAAPASQGQLEDAAVRGLCVALANLAIQCSTWARPLETLGPRLSQQRMLEFLTLLPQECEDAAAAAQSASAEQGWALKARAHEWSPEVAAWLHSVHSSGGSSSGGGSSPSRSPGGQPGTAAGEALTLAVLRCFAAWVKWGCLQYVETRHAAYFATLAGELLFASDAARGQPFHPVLLPAAVDAATEIIEHAPEELQPLLLQLAGALPARAAVLRASGNPGAQEAAEELCHVFALFCSTHCALCAAAGPQGEALREGQLQLLSLPLDPGSEAGGAALPAIGALSDLLEHLVAQQRGERSSEDESGGGSARPMGLETRRAFAAAALDVLLVQLQPYPAAFDAPPVDLGPGVAAMERGMHSPEGVPDALRKEAALVVDYIADLLGVDAVMRRLVAHADGAAGQHGGCSAPAALAALDVCLLVLEGMGGLLESCCTERSARDPPPEWLEGFLRLYALVPDPPAGWEQGSPAAAPAPTQLLTILHADLLSSFAAVGHLVMPLLQASQQQHQQAMQQLVLSHALCALSACPRTPDVGPGSTEDVLERAAAALRMLCSSATTSGLPTSPKLLVGVQQAMALLQAPIWRQRSQYQDAHCQLVTGLVHALHGIPPGDAVLRAAAEAAVQQAIFAPLAAALQELAGLGAAVAAPGQAPGAPLPLAAAAQQRAVLWRLHAALRQLQALLNGLESYALYDGASDSESSTSGAGGSSLAGQEVARGVAAAAVGVVLVCWPQLAEVCAWRSGGASLAPAGSGTALQRELYGEVAHCLSSCIGLDPEAFRRVLPSFCDTAAACFFLPGAAVLSRPLIQAIEAYGAQPPYQQPLLGTVRAVLGAPAGRQLAALRGGDADPEAAQALLSLLGCCLRQACQWRQVAAAAELETVLRLGLPLAVANTACHHKDTSYQAVSTLAALLALVLERGSPLHGALLGFAAQQGAALLEGLLLALLSLNSGSHLPKVVSLMSDVALLVTTLAQAQLQQQGGSAAAAAPSPEALCSAAGSQVAAWLAAVRSSVTASGILSEEATAALLQNWDWQPCLQQAALQLAALQLPQRSGASGNGGNSAELRRAMQRSVRQLADLIRRGSSGAGASPALVAA
ncbi:hypothetical protein ABPG75_012929 [Micractinium tetrahymenae]